MTYENDMKSTFQCLQMKFPGAQPVYALPMAALYRGSSTVTLLGHQNLAHLLLGA